MKNDIEDNLLFDMISESNEDALNSLYERYVPLISFLVKKYSGQALRLGLEKKDLVQEANLAFADAINSYNPDKDASLKTFISLCVERRLINIINKNNTRKSQIGRDTLSLEFEYDEDGSMLNNYIADSRLDPSNTYLEKEDLKELKEKINSCLSGFEMQVYQQMLNGFSYQQIALLLDKNPKQIDNTIQRIRIKLRSILEGENNV